MNRITLSALGALLASTAVAQVSINIYDPIRPLRDQHMSVNGWGGGAISETAEVSSSGAYSLRITSSNFFQGGLLNLQKPVDLSGSAANPNHLFMIAFYVPADGLVLGKGSFAEVSRQAGKSERMGKVETTGKKGTLVKSTGSGNTMELKGAASVRIMPTVDIGKLRSLRVVVTTTDNLHSETYIPLRSADGQDWRRIAIPVQSFAGFDRTNKTIKSILVTSEAKMVFYVGEVSIVDDSTPISGELNVESLDLALGDEVQLIATAFAGMTVLKYEWDFDDTDGIQVDAEGPVIKRKFRKPGTFNVTCTVTDKFGAKPPKVLKAKVKVND